MPRTDAASIVSGGDADKLAESSAAVMESVQKAALSELLKNTNYSGDATTGSVEVSRFANSEVKSQGTARTNASGDALDNSGKVTINVDTDKEIVEEVKNKDIALHGVTGIVDKRKLNHAKRMAADLDRAFFTEAEAAGSSVVIANDTAAEDALELLIQAVETTENDWVDGVDRDMIQVSLTPAEYGKVRKFIDGSQNGNVDTSVGEFGQFHGVFVYSNHRQTEGAIAQATGAVAQLVLADPYDAERIPLSNDTAVELFYSRGTKAVAPDLIVHATTLTPTA